MGKVGPFLFTYYVVVGSAFAEDVADVRRVSLW